MATIDAQTSPIYFNSVYRHGVDDKRRVQVPAKWRPIDPQNVEYTLVAWPNSVENEICLLGLLADEWRALVERLKALPYNESASSLRRLIGKNSEQVFLDKAGRICLPEKFAQVAEVGSEAVLVGLVHRFEIWNPARYESKSRVDEAHSSEALRLLG